MFFKVLRLVRFYLPYKFHFIFLLTSGMVFGAVNNGVAAITGFFVRLFGAGVTEEHAAVAMLGDHAAKPWVREWVLPHVDSLTRTDLFYFGVAAFSLLVLFLSLFVYLQGYLGAWLATRVGINIREFVVAKMLSMDLSYFKKKGMNDVLQRIGGDLGATQGAFNNLSTLFSQPMIMAVCLAYVLWLNWELTLLALVGMPLASVLLRKLFKKIRRTAQLSLHAGLKVGQSVLQFISGIATVKAFACEEFEMRNFKRCNEIAFQMATKNARAQCAERPLTSIASKFGVLIVFIVSGHWIMSGRLQPADLVSFIIALSFMNGPAKEFSRAMASFYSAMPNCERVFEVLDAQNEVPDGTVALDGFNDAIEFSHVNFSYNQDAPVIHDFSLRIPKGKRVALVGVSGSGKTTMLNLLLRLYQVDSGVIGIDGKNINDLTFKSLRERMGLVSQSPFLFNCSIRENITYGQTTYTAEAVETAARMANLHNEIMAMPQGYETVIGDGGDNLSGGQRQRLCIARALYKNAPILLLDEATSALDSENEHQVQIALDNLMAGRTSITIAHRLSTVKNSDEIIMLAGGRIIGQGPHAQLVKTCPEYARLVELQGL
ncbi:lipid A export permease/ATP-binding protein MsbA [Planctomycetales bacterium]|nr:lipid A export permease/ATP-binding protein MsbA [Planctomycetales bacterium]GHT00606.1 lipid A export permease/ATP-binding protein MsbA [Planctomycetales bacterium]GHT08372.1 lipid A export permease/ATP-binding protein MsbA [Planctomycetales bacterium]